MPAFPNKLRHPTTRFIDKFENRRFVAERCSDSIILVP